MAVSAFGTPFNSGKSSGAGYGTPLGVAAGRSPERQAHIDSRRSEIEAERAAKKLETEGASYPTNEEERETKNFEKAVEDGIKAEEKAAAEKAAAEKAAAEKAAAEKAAAEKAAAEKAAAEKAKRDRDAAAKGETQTGVLEAPPNPTPEAGNQPANPTAPSTPKATPEQLRARQAVARNLRDALGADEGEDRDAIIEGARKDAAAAGVSNDAFNSFLEREKAQPPLGTYGRPTQEQIAARQDAANRIKAGIRSGDSNVLSAAREDAELAGVVPGDVYDFITRQEEELAKRGQISRVGASGKPSGLDEYYQTQTEKSRGIPTGYSSGKGRPIAPAHRIHTRLNRLVNRRTYEGDQDRSISKEAATMRYDEALAKKLSPLDLIKMQRDLADKRRIALETGEPLDTNPYGFGRQ